MRRPLTALLIGSFFLPGFPAIANTPSYPQIQETISADEPELARALAEEIANSQRSVKSGEKILRGAHGKHHGCVNATFTVGDDLPRELQVGVFQPKASYTAWARFSNGSSKVQDDHAKDARGLAIKLVTKSQNQTFEEQDFVMINHPVFFVRNAKDMLEFTSKLKQSSLPLSFFFPGINPITWRLKEMGILFATASHQTTNPLDTTYWSATPYSMGPHAAKFSVSPCKEAPLISFDRKDPNFLRLAMEEHLKAAPACFDFFVQMQTNPKTMPIEDPTVEWSEAQSPYIRVARLEIPTQKFNTEFTNQFCEALSFSPWNALPEHRPLGSINRVRKVIYESSSKVRHEANQQNQ